MTAEQEAPGTNAAEAPGLTGPIQIAEQLADKLWRLTEAWNDFARTTVAVPLTRAMDDIGLQLRFTLGRTPVKQHLQHIENARGYLISADYYLQRAHKRGLMESTHVDQLRGGMIELARRLERHSQAIVQAAHQKIAEKKLRENKDKAAQNGKNPELPAGTTVAH
jgi:23S rRNA-intervening sequence protein